MNGLITELRSEALKERHWEKLTRELRVNWNLNELTLGQVWEADLVRQENVIRQILLVAQGELALEVFLKQVKEYWQGFAVELVNYQNKTFLIRGWDELFNKLKEHINSLTAMKLSPYYKEFEEDAMSWEDRLNKINALFDVWIDVQRRWVYLEGLFSGSADIATLLPMESSKFNGVSNEFLALMKRVSGTPRILEIVHFQVDTISYLKYTIQGVQRLLERLAEVLAKIQKALGEYLERERSSFPRFYFVGDEDLLEIMGNSKDMVRIQKHLKKMFAGIMSVEFDEETRQILSLYSRESEVVTLETPVDLKKFPRINDWLRELELEMQRTLAKQLQRALEHFSQFDVSSMSSADYMKWLDGYPVRAPSSLPILLLPGSSGLGCGRDLVVDDGRGQAERREGREVGAGERRDHAVSAVRVRAAQPAAHQEEEDRKLGETGVDCRGLLPDHRICAQARRDSRADWPQCLQQHRLPLAAGHALLPGLETGQRAHQVLRDPDR